MSFLYPTFLFALFAIAIPIIIHLFNFRKFRVVYFSNVKFLQNVLLETKAKSKLKHLLILLLRILTIAAAVIAFAQPFIPDNTSRKNPASGIVSIHIDNSFSMDAEGKEGNLLEVAKNKARSIATAFPAGTKFLLTTNDRDFGSHHQINKEQVLENISKIQISPNSEKLSNILTIHKDGITEGNPIHYAGTSFIISDFQQTGCDLENCKSDSLISVQLTPVSAQATNNLYIDSCWFEIPFRKFNQQEEIFVRIVNSSAESYNNIPVKIFINDSLKALASFNIQAESDEIVSLKFSNNTTGLYNGKIEISDYPITYDNTFYFGYKIASGLNLLIINGQKESKFFTALYENEEYIKVSQASEKTVQTSQINNSAIVILNEIKLMTSGLIQELGNHVKNGGSVVFIPAWDGDIESYNQFLGAFKTNLISSKDTAKKRIAYIEYNSDIYKNVFQKKDENQDMPVISGSFVLSAYTNTQEIPLLKTQDGRTLLSQVTLNKGSLYSFYFPISKETSNFSKHPLFVPTMLNMALNCNPSPNPFYTIGVNNTIDINNLKISESDRVFHIKNILTNTDFIPQQTISGNIIRLNVQNQVKQAGNYHVIFGEEAIETIAYNYNRAESNLRYYNEENLSEKIKQASLKNFSILDAEIKYLSKAVDQINKGIQLWKLFVLLALLFLGTEIALLRLWKS